MDVGNVINVGYNSSSIIEGLYWWGCLDSNAIL